MPESFSFYFITHIAVKQFTISQQNHKNYNWIMIIQIHQICGNILFQ